MGKNSSPRKHKGPRIANQHNAAAIDEALGRATSLSDAQKQELIDAAEDTNTDLSRKTQVSTAICEQIVKTVGGGGTHHCARKKHNNPDQCRKDGCIIPCEYCGAWISIGYNSKCRNCLAIAVGKRLADAARKKEEEEEERLAKEAAEKLAMTRQRSAQKPKWQPHVRDKERSRLGVEHEKEHGKVTFVEGGDAHMVQVYGPTRVSKRKGRTGQKGKKKAKARLTRRERCDLTINAALVFLLYSEDEIEALALWQEE